MGRPGLLNVNKVGTSLLFVLLAMGGVAVAEDDPDAEIAARHIEQAVKLFEAKSWAKALAEFEAAQLVKPKLSTEYSIGRCLEKLGKTKEAFKSYLRVLDATNDPALEVEVRKHIKEMRAIEERAAPLADENTHFEKARKLFDAKQYEKALAEFEASRQSKPPPPQIDFNVAKCLDRLERYKDAIAAYQRFLDTRPDPFEAEPVVQRLQVLTARVRLLDEKAGKKPGGEVAAAKGAPAPPAKSGDPAKPEATGPDPFRAKAPEAEAGKLPKDDEAARRAAAAPPAGEPPVVEAPPPTPDRPRPFLLRHLIPVAVGGGAIVAEVVGIALALSVAPSFVALANSCAPQCDPAEWQGLDARVKAGYAFIAIGALAAVADAALWVWELKLKKEPPRAWLLPAPGGFAAGGRF